VGFLDSKHLNYQNPDKMGEHIKFIGPFKQGHDPYFNTYLDQALGDAIEPSEKSTRF
jgi:hypothetical protein